MQIVAVVAGAGCLSTPPPAQYDAAPQADADVSVDAADCPVDDDGDGYLHAACAATDPLPSDCDDGLAAVHPGAFDSCDDGVDQDCLGGDLPCGAALPINATTAADDKLTIAAGGLELVIDDVTQAPLELHAGGDNLLYTGNDINERLAGVEMFDEYYSWRPLTASRTVEADGRALTRVRIDWSADQSGDPGTVGLEGTSVYTMHPDGRVVRDESFAVREERLGVWLTGYYALDPLQFTHIDWTDNPDDPFPLATFSGMNQMARTESEYICTYDAASGLRLGWAWRPVSPPGGAGPRATENAPGGWSSLALQYDWNYGGNPPDESSYNGSFLLLVDGIGTGERCDAAPAPVAAFLAPPALDGAAYDAGGGYYVVDAAGGSSVQLTAAAGTSAPLSLRVDAIGTAHDPVIDVDGTRLEHGRDYLYQADATGGWLYLPATLAAGAVVQVRIP